MVEKKKPKIGREGTIATKSGVKSSAKTSDYNGNLSGSSDSFTQECLVLRSVVNGIHKCEVGFVGNQEKNAGSAWKIEVIDDTALLDAAALSGFQCGKLKRGNGGKEENENKKKCLGRGSRKGAREYEIKARSALHNVEGENVVGKRARENEFSGAQMGMRRLMKCPSENGGEKKVDQKKFLNAHMVKYENGVQPKNPGSGSGFKRVYQRKDTEGKMNQEEENMKNRHRTDHQVSKNGARTNGIAKSFTTYVNKTRKDHEHNVCGFEEYPKPDCNEKVDGDQNGKCQEEENTEESEKKVIHIDEMQEVLEKPEGNENCSKADMDDHGMESAAVSDEKRVEESKRVYSRKKMEALRYVEMEKQWQKWAEIYCALPRSVAREYVELLQPNPPKPKLIHLPVIRTPPLYPICSANCRSFA